MIGRTSLNIALNSFYLPSVDKIGVGYQAHYMANALVRRGHAVTMFSPAPRCGDALYEHRQLDAGRRFRLNGFAVAMRRVDFSAFDVLHSHGEDHLLLGRRLRCHVRTIHGSGLQEALNIPGVGQKMRMLYIAAMESLSSAIADRAVAVSTNTTKSYPWIKRVIPNGVDTAFFFPGQKEPDPTLLFVGTYHNRKRGKFLMEVFAREVLPKVPNAKLWMVCSDAPPAPNVEVTGRLSTAQLTDRYRRAWAFCLPSTYEGFGVPYIEAMASGTAVVATHNLGSAEVLGQGSYGSLVDDDQLGLALVRMLIHEGERHRFEQIGLQRVARYSWETVAAKYEALYNEVLSRRSAAA